MKRFKKILWVVDKKAGKSGGFDRAVSLAQDCKGQLTVVSILTSSFNDVNIEEIGLTRSELKRVVIKTKRAELEHLIAPLKKKRLRVDTKVLIGIPFVEIIKEVLRGKFDVVMKESEGKGGVTARLFGSLDRNLMRKCPCPVWITKPTRSRRYRRILAAFDPLAPEIEDPRARLSLNAKILELAESLSVRENSRFDVIHAWNLYKEFTVRGHYGMTERRMQDILRGTRKRHNNALIELLQECRVALPADNVHLVKGEPEKVIPAMAKKFGSDLIVMGTVGRTGIPGFFIGNTAEEILERVDSSVLTVKPDSFKTPVKLGD